ncbi:hypothetical protein [Burkholderia paludis]|uniref:hypothetical protein n=1 Tax=Burkholderia paludis TaxID=1506587 RepID=UPI001269B61D|nr:hypothetical protein [Burkholderia paludis]
MNIWFAKNEFNEIDCSGLRFRCAVWPVWYGSGGMLPNDLNTSLANAGVQCRLRDYFLLFIFKLT